MELRRSGKATKEIVSEYKITKASLHMWEKQFTNRGKCAVIDNLSDGEKELRELRKNNISAMCRFLKLPRSSFYYAPKVKSADAESENAVIDEFHKSRNNYGTRKLKIVLATMTFATLSIENLTAGRRLRLL